MQVWRNSGVGFATTGKSKNADSGGLNALGNPPADVSDLILVTQFMVRDIARHAPFARINVRHALIFTDGSRFGCGPSPMGMPGCAELPDDEPLVLLWVICTSTAKEVFLRVPPHITDAREARDWTFNVSLAEAVET